jgi:eukaryotic-like serine/threonine-protein kinase
MPRQQVLDFKYVSEAVDVWAAAASLYFALSGHCPRDFPAGRDPWRVVWDTDAVPLGHRGTAVPAALAGVVDDALVDEKDELPYQTVAGFRDALTAAYQADGATAP